MSIMPIEFGPIIQLDNFSEHEVEYEVDINSDWFKEVLKYLEKEVQVEDGPQGQGDIYSHLYIKRIKNNLYKDHLIIKGRITAAYTANCVKCLTPVDGDIDAEFKVVFLHKHFEDSEELKETTHIFCDNDELELYFHDKGKVDLKELLLDQVLIHLDTLPVHSEECKGLCQHCGIDKNLETCNCS